MILKLANECNQWGKVTPVIAMDFGGKLDVDPIMMSQHHSKFITTKTSFRHAMLKQLTGKLLWQSK